MKEEEYLFVLDSDDDQYITKTSQTTNLNQFVDYENNESKCLSVINLNRQKDLTIENKYQKPIQKIENKNDRETENSQQLLQKESPRSSIHMQTTNDQDIGQEYELDSQSLKRSSVEPNLETMKFSSKNNTIEFSKLNRPPVPLPPKEYLLSKKNKKPPVPQAILLSDLCISNLNKDTILKQQTVHQKFKSKSHDEKYCSKIHLSLSKKLNVELFSDKKNKNEHENKVEQACFNKIKNESLSKHKTQKYVSDKVPTKIYKKIEDYIMKKIGYGSFSQVFVAINRKNYEEMYIIKKIKKHGDQACMHYNFEQESLRKLNHAFIRKLICNFEMDKYYSIVFECVLGPNLFDFMIYNKGLSTRLTKFYAYQIGIAMQFIHDNSLVYGDLKCENIMICSDGYIKLIDFGFCVTCGPNDYVDYKMGTEGYCSPETIFDDITLQKSDVWSYGCLIYLMITARFFSNEKKTYSANEKEKYCNDVTDELNLDENLGEKTRNFLQNILVCDPKKRLDFFKILKHEWFKNFDYNYILHKQMKAPWLPLIEKKKYRHNSSYFEMFDCNYKLKKTPINDCFWNEDMSLRNKYK